MAPVDTAACKARDALAAEATLIGDLAIVMVVAASTGLVARRLGQPSVLGYLLAGLIVGPYIPIPLFADPHRIEEFAEVGVVLVMLAVGLEFRVKRLLEILPLSGLTGVIQIATLAWAGFSIGSVMGWTTAASVTLGACLAISSTMVVSAVLRARPVDPDVRSHVFGVLVVQDVVAIALIAVVTALAAGQTLGAQDLGTLAVELGVVVVAMLVLGLLVLPRLVRWVVGTLDSEAIVVVVAGAGFGFAYLAQIFGYSVALGAFLAGMAVAESGKSHEVEEAIEPLRAMMAALFFVSIGMAVDPVMAWKSLPLALVLTVVVVGAQLLSVGIASVLSGISIRRSIFSGLALGQIGELSFIMATIAVAGQVAPPELLPALVTVATLTAFTTPFLLSRGERLVAAVDHWMPHRATRLLVAYQSLGRRLRTSGDGPSIRGPAQAVALDWAALVFLIAVGIGVAPRLDGQWVWIVDGLVLLVAIPFVVGLVRSGLDLAAAVRTHIRRAKLPPAVARSVESLGLLTVVLMVGVPTVTVLRPLESRSWAEMGLVAVVIALVVILLRRMGGVGGEGASGVHRLARGLARHVGDDAPSGQASSTELAADPLLAGIDTVRLRIEPGFAASGRTLAELELRVRSGASVVAIQRADATVQLPTGHEQLQEGDELAVAGSDLAVQRALAVLRGDGATA